MPTRAQTDAAFACLLAYVKRHPRASYQEAADAAAAAGHRVFPIQFTRARAAIAAPGRRVSNRETKPKLQKRTPRKALLVIRNAADLATWSEIVARINTGARAELKGNGERWQIVVR